MIDASPRDAQAQGRADVAIVDGAYQPGSILVQAGDTVTWTNTGNTPHTVTADDGSVDSGPLVPGASFSQTFPVAALFTYHCAIHPRMIGAITITAAPNQGGSTINRVPTTGVGMAPRASLPLSADGAARGDRLGERRLPGASPDGVASAWPGHHPCRCSSRSIAKEMVAVVLLALAPLLLLAPSASAARAGSGPEASGIPAGDLAVGGRRRSGWRAGDDRRPVTLHRAVLARWPPPGPARLQSGQRRLHRGRRGPRPDATGASPPRCARPDSAVRLPDASWSSATPYAVRSRWGAPLLHGDQGRFDLQPA